MLWANRFVFDTRTDLTPGTEVIDTVKWQEALGFKSPWLSAAMRRRRFALEIVA